MKVISWRTSHESLILLCGIGVLVIVTATPEKSINVINEYNCTNLGYFADPQNPNKYYQCVMDNAFSTGIVSVSYKCAPGECYDAVSFTRCGKLACKKQKEEYTCLREHLQTDAQVTCLNETLTYLKRDFPKYLEFTSFRGDPFRNFVLSMRDVNFAMRHDYAKMIEGVGKNVYPLIVATDAEPDFFGVGGVVKIYFKDGSMRRIVPVNPAFEIHKSLSHVVLGIFSIISPYFMNPESISWRTPLRQFREKCHEALVLLGVRGNAVDENIAEGDRSLIKDILRRSISYIDQVSRRNSVDHEGYRRFANDLAPLIEKSMILAAKAHAEDTIVAFQKLKEELGEEEWRRAFVIIPTIWPVSLYNIRLQALEKVMSFEQIKSQVIIVEGVVSEAQAKVTLGRILADRAVAELVWGGLEDESMRDHLFSLQTRRDLLSSLSREELNDVCKPTKLNCPFAGRSGKDRSGSRLESRMPATMLRT